MENRWNSLLCLHLPIETIRIIASYDRILSIKKIPNNDYRYEVIKTIPRRCISIFAEHSKRTGYEIKFTNHRHRLFITYKEDEFLFTYLNMWQDESESYIYE